MIGAHGTGRLGKDCETKHLEGGRVLIAFSVACDRGKDRDGKRITQWVKCVMFRDAGKEGIASYLKKGTQIYFEGDPEAKAWKGNDGEPKAELSVVVKNLELLSSAQDGQSQPTQNSAPAPAPAYTPPSAAADGQGEDDLPF